MISPVHDRNRMKLGIFCYHRLSGISLHPDVWRPGWADFLGGTRKADLAGLKALVPIARWKGYVDDDAERRPFLRSAVDGQKRPPCRASSDRM